MIVRLRLNCPIHSYDCAGMDNNRTPLCSARPYGYVGIVAYGSYVGKYILLIVCLPRSFMILTVKLLMVKCLYHD